MQLQMRYANHTTPLQLRYTTLHPAVVGEVTDQVTTATIATTPKNTAPTSFQSARQWIRSAIRDSQQPSSPIGFLFWSFRHRLVRYYGIIFAVVDGHLAYICARMYACLYGCVQYVSGHVVETMQRNAVQCNAIQCRLVQCSVSMYFMYVSGCTYMPPMYAMYVFCVCMRVRSCGVASCRATQCNATQAFFLSLVDLSPSFPFSRFFLFRFFFLPFLDSLPLSLPVAFSLSLFPSSFLDLPLSLCLAFFFSLSLCLSFSYSFFSLSRSFSLFLSLCLSPFVDFSFSLFSRERLSAGFFQ